MSSIFSYIAASFSRGMLRTGSFLTLDMLLRMGWIPRNPNFTGANGSRGIFYLKLEKTPTPFLVSSREKKMADPLPVGKILSGLFVVTASRDSRREGFLASWIQQASFQPLMLSMAVQADRPILDFLRAAGKFCVNVI